MIKTMIKAQTLKGFRDFLPKEAKKRQYVINTLKEVFELYGFEPLETPALEYEEVLLGKYGEEGDKLMYRFTDRGGRKVALRYDQTVPLARVVSQYSMTGPGPVALPFKRYQIQPVWRAENPQKGRFREFLQCDADIIGSDSPLSDAKIIVAAAKSLEKLGFINYKILINDRKGISYFKTSFDIPPEKIILVLRGADKLKKIGEEGILKELVNKGNFSAKEAKEIIDNIKKVQPTENLNIILSYLKNMGIEDAKLQFSPTLARGLDYYTGMIFEVEIEGYSGGSVAGGGRYDNLIGMFSGKPTPAVGFSFGFDRLIEAMDQLNLFPEDLITTKVLVTIFSPELADESIKLATLLRQENINTELWLDPQVKLDKQLKYADQKGIPYVVILGPEEVKQNLVVVKDMRTGKQEQIPQGEIINRLQ